MKRFLGIFVFLYILLLDVSLGYSLWVGDFYIDGIEAGKAVTVTAPKKIGYDFSSWEVSLGSITLNNPTSNPMTISMPSNDVGIYPSYIETNINTSLYGTNLGDIDLDSKISMSDVNLLLNYLNQFTDLTAEQLLRADVNSDGKVNGFDLVLLSAFVNRYVNEWPLNIKCGDVTLDGSINSIDSQQLLRYLGGYRELSQKQLLAADVNLDGSVDRFDVKLIAAYCVGKISELPIDFRCGDLNGDGVISGRDEAIIRKYVQGKRGLTARQEMCVDVNLDGKTDKFDIALILCIRAGYIGSLPVDVLYGDVDGNGVVNSADSIVVLNALDGEILLTDEQLTKADVNLDGMIDETDAQLIHEYYLENIPTIPVGPMYGDIDGDGDVDSTDVEKLNAYLSGTLDFSQVQAVSADVNLDDVIDEKDLQLIQQYISHIIPALPVLDNGDELSFTWDTTDQLEKTIWVKTNGTTTIDWGDGSTSNIANSPNVILSLTHTYASARNYTVKILDDVATYLNCSGMQLSSLDVSSATMLTHLNCNTNSLTSLDVSNNIGLKELYCNANALTSLDISHNTVLQELNCSNNNLSSIDVHHNTALEVLNCQNMQLTSLDIIHNIELKELYCNNNQLTNLNVSNNVALEVISCGNNNLTSLDISHNIALRDLPCDHNALTSLDVSHNLELERLTCAVNPLGTLDVSHNTELKHLNCWNNNLTALDVSNNTKLTYLGCPTNNLSSLDVSHNTELVELGCGGNSQLTNLDLSHNTILKTLSIWSTPLTSLDVSNNLLLETIDSNNSGVPFLIEDSRQNVTIQNRHPNTKVITITQTPHGRIEYAGGKKFNIIPDAGYAIASLTAGGVVQTKTGTYDFGTFSGDKTLTATFTPIGVGSYVSYSAGGYTGDWVVLRNSTGQLEIISKESVGDVTLGGAEGYANAVSILNSKAKEYINYNYAVSARSVGSTVDSIEQIDTTQYPLTYEAGNAAGMVLPYQDTYYLDDTTIIANNANLKHSSGNVWLASRILGTNSSYSYFNVHNLYSSGTAYNVSLFAAGSGGDVDSFVYSLGFRPVVTLRADLRVIGGSGTQADPYVLGIPHESVPVGSYISYTGGDYEGNWVVLRDTPVGLELISKESVGDLTLEGTSGYATAVATLNAKSQQYVNPNYAVTGRSVGATADSIGIMDTTALTWAVSNSVGKALPYYDEYCIGDKTLIENNVALKHTSGNVWFASRDIYTVSSRSDFYVAIFDNSGDWVNNSSRLLVSYPNGSMDTYSYSYGVRPVITLRGDLEITGGSGTQGDPYTLGVKERRVAETGSYITYNGGDYTGDWVVLKNKDGQLEIISKESVGDVTLSGATGYANAVSILNNKAQQYLNANYATGARSVGATENSIGQIDTTENPLTFAAAREQKLPYHDEYYTSDMTIIKNNPMFTQAGVVWVAGRALNISSNDHVRFSVRDLDGNANFGGSLLYTAYSDGTSNSNSSIMYGFRPVITLREDMEIVGGSGLQSDPYRIAVPKEKVAVGSYVQYSAGDYNGDWVVLRNKAGQLEIISKESVGDVTLGSDSDVNKAKSDYANAINILNTKAREYVNTNYAVNARSVGATENSIGFIDTTKYPITYSAASATGQTLPYNDKYCLGDQAIISGNDNLKHTSGYIWLASRYLDIYSGGTGFCVNGLEANGSFYINYLFYQVSDSGTGYMSCTYGFRPVVTLRSDIEIIGGSGTQADPYILGTQHKSLPVGSYVSYSGGDYAGNWVVLRDTDVGLELISKESVGDLTLGGAYGYANAVRILNNKAKQYVNSTSAVAGRSVGATANSVQEINTTTNPLTYEATRTSNLAPYGNAYAPDDQTIIAGNENLQHSSNGNASVWLASRHMQAYDDRSNFRVWFLNTNGSAGTNNLFIAYSDSSTATYSGLLGVRPVITLRGYTKTTGGSGTSGSPYTLGF